MTLCSMTLYDAKRLVALQSMTKTYGLYDLGLPNLILSVRTSGFTISCKERVDGSSH